MNAKEAIKKLNGLGFIKVNQVGSHLKYSRGSESITIVVHSSMKEDIHPKNAKRINNLK